MTNLFWTSTQFQDWKSDCTKHIANHLVFEVQDIYRPEYEKFCVDLCEQHHYTLVMQKHTAICTPPTPS